MAYFGKEFTFSREENYMEFIQALVNNDEMAKKFVTYKPSHKVEKNGDTYKFTTTTPNDTREVSFKNGETVDEVVVKDKLTAKSTFTIDGDTIIQHQDFGEKGTITFKREYSPNEIKVTMTTSKWDGTAYRWYTA